MTEIERCQDPWWFDCQMRVGRKLRRTLYLIPKTAKTHEDHVLFGMADSRGVAAEIARRWNADIEARR